MKKKLKNLDLKILVQFVKMNLILGKNVYQCHVTIIFMEIVYYLG